MTKWQHESRKRYLIVLIRSTSLGESTLLSKYKQYFIPGCCVREAAAGRPLSFYLFRCPSLLFAYGINDVKSKLGGAQAQALRFSVQAVFVM